MKDVLGSDPYRPLANERVAGENPPFASCHASHLAVLSEDEVLAVWFAGAHEGDDDVAIWSARRSKGAWSQPQLLAHDTEEPHWNPVLHRKEDGELVLFYKIGRHIKSWRTIMRTSADSGRTWSAPRELVPGDEGGRGPVRNKLIVLHDGAWLAPASTEEGIWRSFADRSDDEGRTWSRSADVSIRELEGTQPAMVTGSDIPVSPQSFIGRGVIQPTLWESAPEQVHMLMRSSEGAIYRSDSRDGGRTWSEAYRTELPNNNSGIDLARLQDGLLALVFNPVGQNWGPRTPLVVRLSRDNGQTWGEEYVLEDDEGEYSYPAMVAVGNRLYVTYTDKRRDIAFRLLELQGCCK